MRSTLESLFRCSPPPGDRGRDLDPPGAGGRGSRFFATALLLVSLGCASSFEERHYFKSVDAEGKPVHYYRLTVDGGTWLASSRYLSGYFDERAVDAYFGEIAQPAKGRFEDRVAPESETIPVDPKFRNRSLVLLLSSNSDEIANQIGGLAQNQQLAATLTRLANRGSLEAARTAESDLAVQKARGRVVQALGDELIAKLADAADETTVRAAFLQFVNALAAELGNEAPFENLDQAADWLKYNRGRALRD